MDHAIAPGRTKWLALVGIGGSGFLSTVGGGAFVTVLPIIQNDLHADVFAIGLTLTLYQLIAASLMLAFGRLGDLRGHRRVFLIGLIVFIVGSGFCALAPTVETLIVARGVQALGAAMLFSNTIAILIHAFGTRERGRALGVVSVFTYSGLTAGPPIAGILTDAFGWRSVLVASFVVGLVVLAICVRVLPTDRDTASGTFDLTGATLLAAAIAIFLITVQAAPTWGPTSLATIGGIASAAVLGAVFVNVERRTPSALLDLRLFRTRAFSAATASSLVNYVCIMAMYVVTPFYLIQGRGLSATTTGLVMAAQPILQVVAAPLVGTLSDHIGTRGPRTAGMALLTLGVLAFYALDANAPLEFVVAALALSGFGTGAFVSPNTNQLMTAAPSERRGTANAVSATTRYLGFAIGSAVAAAMIASAGPAASDPEAIFGAVDAALLVAAAFGAIGIALAALPD